MSHPSLTSAAPSRKALAPILLSQWGWVVVGALVLSAYFVQQYLKLPAAPGHQPYPLGWWGYFDQSKTLESARALASGNLSATQHWYPLGYSILGAVFYPLLHLYSFIPIDLASLLVTYYAFIAFAVRVEVRPVWAALLFLLAVMGDRILFVQWVVPWNTTPVAALIWTLLALTAAHMSGKRRPFVLGAVACAVPLFRPSDVLLVMPCLLAAATADLWQRRLRIADLLWFVAGAAMLAVPYGCLYLAIYGPHPTEYMLISRQIGFTLYDLGWKAYVILVDPRAWFGGGEGLLERCPWIVLALAGLVPALLRGRTAALLAVVMILHGVFYLAYVDLLPSGFWRYMNLHYWTLAYPGYALLAFLLLRDLVRAPTWERRAIGWASLAATTLILCLRVVPASAETDRAKAIDFRSAENGFAATYFGDWELHDDRGTLHSVHDMRAVPIPGGMRVIALRRPIVGNPVLIDGRNNTVVMQPVPPRRWRAAVQFGWPRWLFAPVGRGLLDPRIPGEPGRP